jgi:hypothetical protein
MRAAVAALLLVGCVSVVPGSREDKIRECASEARAEHYLGGATDAEAIEIYRRCLRREGVL